MANVDQKKYLKKYLDDDHSKKRKKKKRSHSGSYSDRVKIIDDDGEHRRKRNYDDDNDLMLTGEDAPQIVGMIDDRPPELKAAEDFRNNSKWKSIASSSVDDRSRNHDRHRDEHRKQYERRSRTPPRKDSSPKRVPDRSKETSSAVAAVSRRRRDSDDDYSPARRRREPENPKHSASYVKSEKRTYQDSEQTYKRDTAGKDYRNYDRGQDKRYEGSSSSNHRRYLTPPPQDTARRDATYHRTENGRSKDHYQPRDNNRNEYSRQPPGRDSRDIPSKFNPFRANPVVSQPQSSTSQHHDNYRRTSPAKNPFRAKPPPSLSPLPDRRGGGGGGDERNTSRPQKPAETYRSRFESSTHTSSGFNGNTSAQHHSVNRKPFNPFKADVKLRERSPLPPSQGSRNSKDSGRGRDENNYNRRVENAQPHRDSHFRAERSAAAERSSHATRFRSRSPLKSEVRSFVSQSFRPVEKSKFDSTDRTTSKQNYDWHAHTHAAQSDSTRKPLSSAVADVRHRSSSDYPSSTTAPAPVRKSRWEGSTHERR